MRVLLTGLTSFKKENVMIRPTTQFETVKSFPINHYNFRTYLTAPRGLYSGTSSARHIFRQF